MCFCVGPPVGAYFAARPLPESWGYELNIYAAPAVLTLVLLVAETIFLIVFLPETHSKAVRVGGAAESAKSKPKIKSSVEQRQKTLKTLRLLHFLFLGIFSGMEFTLSFLTFDC